MVDLELVRSTLSVLAANGRAMTEELIGIDVEVLRRKPSVLHQIRAALMELGRHGWAKEGEDEWGMPTWTITVAGMEKNAKF